MTETVSGLLVLDKPPGITSRDAVNAVQRLLPRRAKVGHTGTLDPLASGVLVICLGHATRLADEVQGQAKQYTSRFRFGATSDSDDADGLVTPTPDIVPVSEADLLATLAAFRGVVSQVPPNVSAVKVAGKRAYAIARAGATVALTPRDVRIDAITLDRYDWPTADVTVACGKGTYIRAIARDLGDRLGVGGHVELLRRTRVGPFRVEDALPADQLAEWRSFVRPMADAVAHLPRVALSADEAVRVRHGQVIAVTGAPGKVAAFLGDELVALGEIEAEGRLRLAAVFPT